MNQDNFESFSKAYREKLTEAVVAKPNHFFYSPGDASTVADKMLKAIVTNPLMVNYGGEGFKRTCKALGIKNTRKAIFEYLGIEKK